MVTKLIFLGGGNMAEAIFAGLVNDAHYTIEVIQRNPDKVQRLQELYPNIKVTTTLEYSPSANDIVILAIKPQQAKEACLANKEKLQHCTLLSVMAGLATTSITNWLNNPRIIRTMPNTPSSIQQGITAIFSSPEVPSPHKTIVKEIFTSLGLVYIANDESEIDKIIPVSSSAVAFVYYFMEGIINSAVSEFGFSKEDATKLVTQMTIGTCGLLNANPDISIAEQRERVTSKRGSTEQGLITFANANLHEITKQAMQNCYNRALEMAKEFN